MNDLELVIGLEMHCELKSNSKAFSSGKNAYSEDANVNVSPVDMAFPGILPVVNKTAYFFAFFGKDLCQSYFCLSKLGVVFIG